MNAKQPVAKAGIAALAAAVLCTALAMTGCESLPGDKKTQGAVIGGATGAAAGAVIAGEDNRLLGAVIGTVIGAGSGYVVGKEIESKDEKAAREANAAKDKVSTFTVEDVKRSNSADLDNDGNVTIAELVALHGAGLDDNQILARLRATSVVFTLTPEQKKTLRSSGLSDSIVDQLETINRNNETIGSRK